jgi:transposase
MKWARQLRKFGLDVRLIAAKTVCPFVQRNQTDAADAQDIWTAGR